MADDVEKEFTEQETKRRSGKGFDASDFRSSTQKKALGLGLALDQEKARARKVSGAKYTESRLKEPFKSSSSKKANMKKVGGK